MYNKNLVVFFSILIIFTVCACSINISGVPDIRINIVQVQGSGNVVSETRAVSGYKALNFSGLGDITIIQGNEEGLRIEAEDNILPNIVTEVKNDTLFIRFVPQGTTYIPSPGKSIRFDLKVKTLEDIQLSGAGKIEATKFEGTGLRVNISGAGNIKMDGLSVNDLSTSLSGAGNLDLSGKADRQDINLSGIGNYNAEKLESAEVKVNVSGAGNAKVWATQSLHVTISGAGSVRYAGNPRLTQQISGAGQVKSLESK